MRRYIYYLSVVIVFQFFADSSLLAQENKIPLDHSVYADWKTISNHKISNDGKWVTYEINPGQGDGFLYIVDVIKNIRDSVARGYDPVFSNQSDYLVFKIKPPFTMTRKAKKEKKNKDQMPKDSLGIWILGQNYPLKYPDVESFKVPADGSGWMAFLHHEIPDTTKKPSAGEDTTSVDITKRKPRGSKLVIQNPVTQKKIHFDHVVNYDVSRKGTAVGFIQENSDTVPVCTVSFFNADKEKNLSVFEAPGRVPCLALDESGLQMAFLYHKDTAKIAGYDLYFWNSTIEKTSKILDSLSSGMPPGWGVSMHGDFWFSKEGNKLFFRTAPIPEKEKKDTLLEDEKYHVDVWNWNDDILQPMQKVELTNEKKRSYQAVWLTDGNKMTQLADEQIREIKTQFRGMGEVVLGFSDEPYRKLISWEASRYRDVYLINIITGVRQLIMSKKSSVVDLSPHGKYILWYESSDSSWYAHDNNRDRLISLTRQIPVHFYEETYDMPNVPYPYGRAGWSEDDRYVYIYDRYDIWKIDLTEKHKPLNLTNEYGRKNTIRLRYLMLDKDDYYISQKKPMFMTGFNENSKGNGLYSGSPLLRNDPVCLIDGPNTYEQIEKARYADMIIWRSGNFRDYPELFVSDLNISSFKKISCTNPQASGYSWGNARLVKWKSYDDQEMEGILYTPEILEEGKKYPMLIYFYERMSSGLHRHYIPSPSRSTINFPWCVSNGYVVFVPDIKYKNGYPGESAFNCVISGTEAMSDQFSFIDKDHMGIQGQSWGGYQVAYLVTRTNIYAAAMAGAPVSNMTSAYGGIRWESGMSRMWQYEESQSRIGTTLWDKTELFIENSPLFYVPEIQTPLLIMHNDNDGAVPWYQGIELFTALRRMNKPAWMLVYNNEEHNLEKWPNRIDLSIRMMQFFDHYLKEAPEPEWMSEGIPAIRKGVKNGYNLIN